MITAIRHYSATLHLNPKYSRAYNRRGNAKYIQGDRVNAEKDWRLAATFASPEFDETMTVAEAKIIKSKILVVEANYEKVCRVCACRVSCRACVVCRVSCRVALWWYARSLSGAPGA